MSRSSSRRQQAMNLVRAAGTGKAPNIARAEPQIRSDCTLHVPADVGLEQEIMSEWRAAGTAAANFRIVWNYGLPFASVAKFHQFLRRNESSIARGCTRMKGVSYAGTYVNVESGSPMYQTYWDYANPEGQKEWKKLFDSLKAKKSADRFYRLMVEFNGYFVSDPGRSIYFFRPAAFYADDARMRSESAFYDLSAESVPGKKRA